MSVNLGFQVTFLPIHSVLSFGLWFYYCFGLVVDQGGLVKLISVQCFEIFFFLSFFLWLGSWKYYEPFSVLNSERKIIMFKKWPFYNARELK